MTTHPVVPAVLADLPEAAGPWPQTPAARAAVALVVEHEPDHLVHHSLRSWFFARHLGEQQGVRAGEHYDEELLFLATVLHDIGLTGEADGSQRFEVDGADRAARFVRDQGLGDQAAEVVWDAVALHTSPGIANRKRPEIALAHAGIGADVFAVGAAALDPALVAAVHARYPRLDLALRLPADVAGRVLANPAKHVPFAFAESAVRHVSPRTPLPDLGDLLAAAWPADRDRPAAEGVAPVGVR